MTSLPTPLISILAGGKITLAVTLVGTRYAKTLDRWNAAELQHSAAREAAYTRFLAACDRAWYFRIKSALDDFYSHTTTSEEEWERIAKLVEQQTAAADEELQRHSENYKRASIVLSRLYFESANRRHLIPAQFEVARAALQDALRRETGLQTRLGIVRKASVWQRLKVGRALRQSKLGVTHIPFEEGDLYLAEDGDTLMELALAHGREWDDLKRSVKIQESRVEDWKSKGLWLA